MGLICVDYPAEHNVLMIIHLCEPQSFSITSIRKILLLFVEGLAMLTFGLESTSSLRTSSLRYTIAIYTIAILLVHYLVSVGLTLPFDFALAHLSKTSSSSVLVGL